MVPEFHEQQRAPQIGTVVSGAMCQHRRRPPPVTIIPIQLEPERPCIPVVGVEFEDPVQSATGDPLTIIATEREADVSQPVVWLGVVGSQGAGAREQTLGGVASDRRPREVDAPEDDEDVGIVGTKVLQPLGDAARLRETARREQGFGGGESRDALLQGEGAERGQQRRGVTSTGALSGLAGTAC